MKKVLFYSVQMVVILSLLLGLQACGSRSGGSDSSTSTTTSGSDDTGTDNPTTSTPAQIALTSTLPAGTLLSQGGETTISASVTDSTGNSVADGTVVTFSASAGTITSSASTVSGQATANFQAGSSGGIVTITALSGTATSEISVQVASGDATSISRVSVVPDQIGVAGSGTNEVSTITFQVLDNGGNPVSDGTLVSFSLSAPLGGGEGLSSSSASTISGLVSTSLHSGQVSGVATIAATVTVNGVSISSEARVTIVSGPPYAGSFSLSYEKSHILGYSYDGLEDKITATLFDRFHNPVSSGNPVYFTTEAGGMALTDADGTPTNLTNYYGQAYATLITGDPRPDTISTLTSRPGLCTILAYTEGEESFVDLNGNGEYDSGEPFDDLGEPFIDADDDGAYDAATSTLNEERYIDVNSNGQYDGPNGIWDANTMVWQDLHVLWLSNEIAITLSPGSASIPAGSTAAFTLTVTDSNGNPLEKDTTISLALKEYADLAKISPSNFTISTNSYYTGSDISIFNFSIANIIASATSDLLDTLEITVTTSSESLTAQYPIKLLMP